MKLRIHIKKYAGIIACLAFANLVFALDGAAQPKPSGLKMHQKGRIRVVYKTEGPNAVLPGDKNQNGIPDQVEDALIQAVAARLLFVEVLGFPDPLKAKHFRQAECVDIRFRGRDDRFRGNGEAYYSIQRWRVPGKPSETLCLGFTIAATLNPAKNMTPAHEFFHLIQYGATRFMNAWYLEGMTRWSEAGLAAGDTGAASPIGAWPLPPERAAEIFEMTYGAGDAFWRPLASRHDPDGTFPAGPALEKLRAMKYTDGTPVLKKLKLPGWRFMRDVLLELGEAEDIAFREQNYDRWSHENRFSPKNNAHILRAVEKVAARYEDMKNRNNTPP